jgi:large subunit ribosomal protein L3
MTVAWDKHGIQFPLTVIKIDNCQVTQVKTVETDKCNALQLGVGHREPKNLSKAMIGHFIKNNISPKKDVKQFRVTPENTLPVGYMLTARHFVPGQFIDVVAKSKGRGMQGVMYRWNFRGLFATHGCSIKHRAIVRNCFKILKIPFFKNILEKY